MKKPAPARTGGGRRRGYRRKWAVTCDTRRRSRPPGVLGEGDERRATSENGATLPCSFGGRPERGAHHGLATLNGVIAAGKASWVLEPDLKNFFGSLSHEWCSASWSTASVIRA